MYTGANIPAIDLVIIQSLYLGPFQVTIITLFKSITTCGKYPGILRDIMSLPHNIIMDMNNVMIGCVVKYPPPPLSSLRSYSFQTASQLVE